MNERYSINQTSKFLVFTGMPKALEKNSVKKNDKLNFTHVVIPNSVINIKSSSFYLCDAVVSVHIPNSVEAIWKRAFSECSSLAVVHIPNSVKKVGYAAFYNCTALASIHISNFISDVGDSAFNGCQRLHKTCVNATSKIKYFGLNSSFSPHTVLLRPRIKPILSLQKKTACRVSKATYSTILWV